MYCNFLWHWIFFIYTCLYSVREKIVTMPRKAEKYHLRRMEKAEKAAQLEKVMS
jgi:hypothetical protein